MKRDDKLEKLQHQVDELLNEKKIEEKVRIIVKARCALAWASILGFVAFMGSILTFYSETVKDASTAALKVILERIYQ